MSEKNESRDWELTCDHCNGSGHVFVERQVAERKTDVQEFKEECEGCEGRGFNIAFEDIPGISEYVKSCRPAATAATEGGRDERQRFETWAKKKKMPLARIGQQYDDFWVDHAWNGWQARASISAPAAGDALALEDLQRLIEYAQTSDDCQYGTLSTGLVRDLTAKAIAALAAQVPQQGEA